MRRLQKDLPPRPGMLMIRKCEVPIDPALAARITEVWRAMLLQVRPTDRLESGLDGAFIRFSMEADGARLGGVTWSPDPATRPGQLVTLAWEMHNYCQGRRAESLAAVEKAVDQLSAGPASP